MTEDTQEKLSAWKSWLIKKLLKDESSKEEILNDNPELTDVIDAAVKEQEGIQVGVVAQELQAVLPELVQEESTTVLSVVPTELKWYLVNAIKELSAKVEELESKLNN